MPLGAWAALQSQTPVRHTSSVESLQTLVPMGSSPELLESVSTEVLAGPGKLGSSTRSKQFSTITTTFSSNPGGSASTPGLLPSSSVKLHPLPTSPSVGTRLSVSGAATEESRTRLLNESGPYADFTSQERMRRLLKLTELCGPKEAAAQPKFQEVGGALLDDDGLLCLPSSRRVQEEPPPRRGSVQSAAPAVQATTPLRGAPSPNTVTQPRFLIDVPVREAPGYEPQNLLQFAPISTEPFAKLSDIARKAHSDLVGRLTPRVA
eukprot:CAMPEP_0178437042 /NCGR_PEP_ID=MMETSP0689_2-20121128/34759_1 /TAXON_ID=160604 /ORGANISM="Amphidinium massartii, Strain CS-259" /LENGTH=263 /DNA_ID=CAMNT_0020059173 /DNA_START=241 /DNA_END=1032 /DNA_ORIENTATION=+